MGVHVVMYVQTLVSVDNVILNLVVFLYVS